MTRLTNAKLREVALAYKAARTRQYAAEAEAKELTGQLLEQLRIRKVDTVTIGGLVLTRTGRHQKVWSIDRLRKLLNRKQFADAVPPTPKVKVLKDLVKTGAITQADLDATVDDEIELAVWVDVRPVAPAA